MLNSLFESSIDKLNIPADMKTAIKQINKICLEAEGQDNDPEPSASSSSATNSIKAGNPKELNETWKYNAYTEAKPNQEAAPTQNETNNDKGMTREPSHVRTSGAPNGNTGDQKTQAAGKPSPSGDPKRAAKYNANVATVQYFLQATEPSKKLAVDGILGPQTIKVIQETDDRKPTGKMDKETQERFNSLLSEAKAKVKSIQAKLGVTQDGLIGKETLAALKKANMQVASVFSDSTKEEANTNATPSKPNGQQPSTNDKSGNQSGNNAQTADDVTSIKFDETKAQKYLKANHISQQEFNVWKQYGIAPIYQRRNPKETQAQIAKVQQGNPQGNYKYTENTKTSPGEKETTSILHAKAQKQNKQQGS